MFKKIWWSAGICIIGVLTMFMSLLTHNGNIKISLIYSGVLCYVLGLIITLNKTQIAKTKKTENKK